MIGMKDEQFLEADIGNVIVIENNNKYHVMVEYSREAIESFIDYKSAKEFVSGYTGDDGNWSIAYLNGRFYRSCIELDKKINGQIYYKVTNLKPNNKSC